MEVCYHFWQKTCNTAINLKMSLCTRILMTVEVLRTDTGGCSVNSGTPGFRCLYNYNYQLKCNIPFILDIHYELYQMM